MATHPSGGLDSGLLSRFWSKVDAPLQDTACWPWRASRGEKGYGQFWLDGDMRRAHRVAYELEKGPIPHGLELDHLCRNRACVNPDHLEPVTHLINMRRGSMNGWQVTHCKRAGHPYNDENTYVYTDKTGRVRRNCRACSRINDRRRRRKPAN